MENSFQFFTGGFFGYPSFSVVKMDNIFQKKLLREHIVPERALRNDSSRHSNSYFYVTRGSNSIMKISKKNSMQSRICLENYALCSKSHKPDGSKTPKTVNNFVLSQFPKPCVLGNTSLNFSIEASMKSFTLVEDHWVLKSSLLIRKWDSW